MCAHELCSLSCQVNKKLSAVVFSVIKENLGLL